MSLVCYSNNFMSVLKWSIEDDFTEPGLDIYNLFIIATILISPVKNSSNDLSVTMTVF